MPTSTLLTFISTHEILAKVAIGCTIPLFAFVGFLGCFVSRVLRATRNQAVDIEVCLVFLQKRAFNALDSMLRRNNPSPQTCSLT